MNNSSALQQAAGLALLVQFTSKNSAHDIV
jgi:hypothetical protein